MYSNFTFAKHILGERVLVKARQAVNSQWSHRLEQFHAEN